MVKFCAKVWVSHTTQEWREPEIILLRHLTFSFASRSFLHFFHSCYSLTVVWLFRKISFFRHLVYFPTFLLQRYQAKWKVLSSYQPDSVWPQLDLGSSVRPACMMVSPFSLTEMCFSSPSPYIYFPILCLFVFSWWWSSCCHFRQAEWGYSTDGDWRRNSLPNSFYPGPHHFGRPLQTQNHSLVHWYQRFANGKYPKYIRRSAHPSLISYILVNCFDCVGEYFSACVVSSSRRQAALNLPEAGSWFRWPRVAFFR